MSRAADQFAESVIAAGLLSAGEVSALLSGMPEEARPHDGEALARLLVERSALTEFQCRELLSGSGTPLVVGDYVLLARIGAGGMGQVFMARHRRMKRLVAVKLLPAALSGDAAMIQRFEREVEAAAKLSHANIVQAYDAGVERGVWYLAMEYVEGNDLGGLVVDGRPALVNFDCYVPQLSGISLIDGKWANENETAFNQRVFADRKPHTIRIAVRKRSVQASVDDLEVIHWEGDPARLSSAEPIPNLHNVWFGSAFDQFKFHKLVLKPLTAAERPVEK